MGIAGVDDAEAAGFGIGALGELGYGEAIDGLSEFLKEPSDPQIQKDACAALGGIAEAEAVPVLKKVAESKRFLGFLPVFPDEVRAAAASALGMIGGDAASEALRRLARDKSPVVKSAAELAAKG